MPTGTRYAAKWLVVKTRQQQNAIPERIGDVARQAEQVWANDDCVERPPLTESGNETRRANRMIEEIRCGLRVRDAGQPQRVGGRSVAVTIDRIGAEAVDRQPVGRRGVFSRTGGENFNRVTRSGHAASEGAERGFGAADKTIAESGGQ